MRFLLTILFILVSVSQLTAQRYELVWSDEFEGSHLDRNTWKIWRGSAFNNELQCYTDHPKNVFVENGVLNLVAHREQVLCGSLMRSFSSARISTDSTSIGWEYGRFEARIQMPEGTGFWPAFWLMPMRVIGWPRGGEIDIMEFRGNLLTETNAAVHYWQQGCEGNSSTCQRFNSQTYDTGINLSESFNIYALEWTPEEFKWYFNDEMFYRVSIGDLPADFDPFTGRFYIILNLAVGGFFLPNPTPQTPFPQALKVDYVRVYQDLNEPPSVHVDLPEPNVSAGEDITIQFDAIDTDGHVEKVEVYLDGELFRTLDVSSFQVVLSGLMEGCYDISAIAYDNDGGISENSNVVTIVVGNGCELRPYNDIPASIPGTIEMWKYDYGGQNVAYFETTPTINLGATDFDVPRTFEAVDILPVEDADTDYAIFESVASEWMSYTVHASQSGTYDLTLYLSTTGVTTSVDIELNDMIVGSFNRIRSVGEITSRTLSGLTFEEGTNQIRVITRTGNATYFTLKIIDSSFVSVNRADEFLPTRIKLHHVYPNPFNPSARVLVELPVSEVVSIEVFSMDGRKIMDIHSGELEAGLNEFHINMTGFSSGAYLIRLSSHQGIQNQLITLLR